MMDLLTLSRWSATVAWERDATHPHVWHPVSPPPEGESLLVTIEAPPAQKDRLWLGGLVYQGIRATVITVDGHGRPHAWDVRNWLDVEWMRSQAGDVDPADDITTDIE